MLIIFCLDRFSKNKIINTYNENRIYISDYINLDLIWNTGIGFGLFSNSSYIVYNLITFLIGIVISILLYLSIVSNFFEKIIYSLIVGGALGNFYDRVIFKAVPDFIDLHYKDIHWFTFNIADVFVSIGIIAFVLSSFYIKKT